MSPFSPYPASPKMKKTILTLLSLTALLAVAAQAQRETPMTETQTEIKKVVATSGTMSEKKKRTREGTQFKDFRGIFRVVGQRTLFCSLDGSERFVCLENLNLERILTSIEENPSRSAWKIDGIYTEFRGENFLLIQRGVVAPGNL